MPREVTLLTPGPLEPATLLAAAQSIMPGARLGMMGESAAQVVDAAGGLVITVVRPRMIAVPDEIERLVGPVPHPRAPVWWTDVVVAPDADPTTAERLLAQIAADTGGTVVE